MKPLRFDRIRIQALLQIAGDRLAGEWLVIGGAAAAAWFSPSRTTEDIDLISLAGTQEARLALMELAADASIPIEAVNSAADFFVRRIAGWRDQLVELMRGGSAVIYRPSATLFLLLKLERLSEADLDDCLTMIEHCARTGESIDVARVVARLDSLPNTDDLPLVRRRGQLRAALVGPSG
jgi:hypothetical protein